MCGSPDATHLVISSFSPLTSLLSSRSFMHVSRKVVSIEGSIPGSSKSLLPKVEASVKLSLASMNVSVMRSKSNSGSFIGALWTHVLSFGYFPLSSLVIIPLLTSCLHLGLLRMVPTSLFVDFGLKGPGVPPFRASSLSVKDNPLPHDQTDYSTNMISSLDS